MSQLRADAAKRSFFDRDSRGEAAPDDIGSSLARRHETYNDQPAHPGVQD
ncbi:MAG TPA: hypothetical protein VHT74_19860 [Acetobacteraceae bacterium]|nr:hypothetical protein [Acetobacteraceae bacterium]